MYRTGSYQSLKREWITTRLTASLVTQLTGKYNVFIRKLQSIGKSEICCQINPLRVDDNQTYNALTKLTMHLPNLQCTYQTYNALTKLTMHLPNLQCTYNALTKLTMHLPNLQCTYQTYNARDSNDDADFNTSELGTKE